MRFLLLLIAAVIAIFAGVAALQLSSPPVAENGAVPGQPVAAPNVATVDIIVARGPIPAGTEITADMIDKQPWPENLVLEGFIPSAGADVIGKVTRSSFQPREPLIASKLANVNDSGFLAAKLPEGMRAVTIATDAITGVAGYVFPGDRVDILFTHNIPEGKKTGGGGEGFMGIPAATAGDQPGYSEVLVANAPVLAINVRETSMMPSPAGMIANVAGSSNTPSSMTLQVSDVDAEKLRLAERVGMISVILRSIKDRENTTPTMPADVQSLTQLQARSEAPQSTGNGVRVIRGGMNSGAAAPKPLFNLLEQK
jgi:pilus assembly protein CpaB